MGVGPMLAGTFVGDFPIDLFKRRVRCSPTKFSEPAARLIASLANDEMDLALAPSQLNLEFCMRHHVIEQGRGYPFGLVV